MQASKAPALHYKISADLLPNPTETLATQANFCSSYCFIFIIFFVGLFVFKNTLGFSVLTAQSLGKHKNSWVKSKYSLGTGEAKFSLFLKFSLLRIPLKVFD